MQLKDGLLKNINLNKSRIRAAFFFLKNYLYVK